MGLVALNRPKALNALCGPLMEELTQALGEWDKVLFVVVVVVGGGGGGDGGEDGVMLKAHSPGPKYRSDGGDWERESIRGRRRYQGDAG